MAKNFKKKLNISVNRLLKKEVSNINPIDFKKIKKIDDCLDLHGNTKREAHGLICDFIDNAIANNFKNIRIITGKGVDGYSPLKNYTEDLLKDLGYNYEFPPENEGGVGAIDIKI